jgi:hypothetical protein
MTPKTQAEILVDEYYQLLGEHIFNGHFDLAKNCAIIAVNEILENSHTSVFTNYWEKVKKEIELL